MGLLSIYDEYQKRKAMAGQPSTVPPVVQVATTPQQPQAGGLLGVYDRIMAAQNPATPMAAPVPSIEVPPIQSTSATENLGMPSPPTDNSSPEMTTPQQRQNPLLDDDKKSRLRTLLSSMFAM